MGNTLKHINEKFYFNNTSSLKLICGMFEAKSGMNKKTLRILVCTFICFCLITNIIFSAQYFYYYFEFQKEFTLAVCANWRVPAPGYSWSGNGGGRRQGGRENTWERPRDDRVFDIILVLISFFLVLKQFSKDNLTQDTIPVSHKRLIGLKRQRL